MKQLIILTLAITFALNVFAESVSFSVSCTIPAIPGVNAPAFPEEKNKDVSSSTKEKNKENKNAFIQKEETRQLHLTDGKTILLTTKTIYPR